MINLFTKGMLDKERGNLYKANSTSALFSEEIESACP